MMVNSSEFFVYIFWCDLDIYRPDLLLSFQKFTYFCRTRFTLFRGSDHVLQNLSCLIKRMVHWLVSGRIMWYLLAALWVSTIILAFGLSLIACYFKCTLHSLGSLFRLNHMWLKNGSTYSINFTPWNMNTFVRFSILKISALRSIFILGIYLRNECHIELKYKQRNTHEEGKVLGSWEI